MDILIIIDYYNMEIILLLELLLFIISMALQVHVRDKYNINSHAYIISEFS